MAENSEADRECAVIIERNFSGWHLLIHAARTSLDLIPLGQHAPYYCVSSILLTALAIEALSNSLLESAIDEDWEDFDSARTIAKIRFLCDKCDIDFHKPREPWATIAWLIQLRNDIVHAKPFEVVDRKIMKVSEMTGYHPPQPLTRMEKQLTKESAARAYKAAYDVSERFRPKFPALFTDSWRARSLNEPAEISAVKKILKQQRHSKERLKAE